MSTQEARERLKLLQGTLDLLLLRTPISHRRTDKESHAPSSKLTNKTCWWNLALFIRASSDRKIAAGFLQVGNLSKRPESRFCARNPDGANDWLRRPPSGSGSFQISRILAFEPMEN
jgi:hypothetical protein